ncbi:hypothetical protein KUCAC02_013229 [Chaenocephalus aceratus]|uniref:Uncharacterized protein n=1 Tax=Chaenocephalus aceratus TaxID=36190 RepID=A0ACB9XDM7_CHAAC|nr:hypothetical protein KUCAC02_013229 [Chaenocephalus aceratus]
MEVKVFVDGIPRVVCGVTEETDMSRSRYSIGSSPWSTRALPHYRRNLKTLSGAWHPMNAYWRLLRNTASRQGTSNSHCFTTDPWSWTK